MKMKKWLILILFILIVIIPFITIPVVVLSTGPVYKDTYYAALSKQYDRLNSIKEEKVILVGGSNVAFGMDSELFYQLYNKPMVSFGLYGSFGVKVMMDLSKTNINKGDIVILAPEISTNALSLYFGAESMLKATESRRDILYHIDRENISDIVGASYEYATQKIKARKSDEEFDLSGIYRNDTVNDYGEIDKQAYPREGNILPTGYISEDVSYDYTRIDSAFIDYVNEYNKFIKGKGATLYYSFAPVNERAVNKETVRDDTYDYYDYLVYSLDCEVISDPYDYIYDYRYFYDTNFHLNDAGVVLRVAQLVRDLKLATGDFSKTEVEIPEPPEPIISQQDIDFTLDYTDSNLFEYEEIENGRLELIGVKEGAKSLESIILPVIHNDKYVVSIRSGALANLDNLKSVTIPVGYRSIDNGVFNGSMNLKEIRILETSQDNVAVADKLLLGVSDDLKIVIVNATISDFSTGYFWSLYRTRMVKEEAK